MKPSFDNTVSAPSHARTGGPAMGLVPRILLLGVAAALAATAVLAGDMLLARPLLFKYDPDWSIAGWLRMAVTALAALLILVALRPAAAQRRPAFAAAGDPALIATTVTLMAATLLAAAALVALVPAEVGELVREGKPLSILTEIVFLVALVFLFRAAWSGRRLDAPGFLGLAPPVILWAMFAVVLLVVMEEMSWGQHWIGWQAGDLFAANEQSETNLHNFATHRFEAVYYTLSFFLFVLLPWAWPRNPIPSFEPLARFVPPRALALAGVALSGLWFNDWNIVPYQIWFFLGLLIALDLAGGVTGKWRVAAFMMMALVIATQIVFFLFGADMEDGHEMSEVREFLIAILVAAYSVLLHRRIHQASAPDIVT